MPCAQFQRLMGDWGKLSAEAFALSALENVKRLGSDMLSQLPRWCLIHETCPNLGKLDGFILGSVSAVHELRDVDEREAAIDAIGELTQDTFFAFVMERRSLLFRAADLKRQGNFVVYVGWKCDSELKHKGFFFEVRVTCDPRGNPGAYYGAFWNEVVRLVGLQDALTVEASEKSWFIHSAKGTLLKCTAGGGKGENPAGLAIYQDKRLDDLRGLLDRFDGMGELRSRIISCNIIGDHYEHARSILNRLGPCWEFEPTCDLLPHDVELIKQGREPTVTRLPGASYVWQSPDNKKLNCKFTCGFQKLDGQWHSVIGASYSAPEAAQTLARLLAAHGYAQTF